VNGAGVNGGWRTVDRIRAANDHTGGVSRPVPGAAAAPRPPSGSGARAGPVLVGASQDMSGTLSGAVSGGAYRTSAGGRAGGCGEAGAGARPGDRPGDRPGGRAGGRPGGRAGVADGDSDGDLSLDMFMDVSRDVSGARTGGGGAGGVAAEGGRTGATSPVRAGDVSWVEGAAVPGSASRSGGVCGTPGCNLTDYHDGPCEPELFMEGRNRARRASCFRDWYVLLKREREREEERLYMCVCVCVRVRGSERIYIYIYSYVCLYL